MADLKVKSIYLLETGIFEITKKNGGVSLIATNFLTGESTNFSTKKFAAIKELSVSEAENLKQKTTRLEVGSTWQLGTDERIYTINEETEEGFVLEKVPNGEEIIITFAEMLQSAIYEVDMEEYEPEPEGKSARIVLRDKTVHNGIDYGTHFIAHKGKKRYQGKAYEEIVKTNRLTIL